MRDDAVLRRALPLGRGLGHQNALNADQMNVQLCKHYIKITGNTRAKTFKAGEPKQKNTYSC